MEAKIAYYMVIWQSIKRRGGGVAGYGRQSVGFQSSGHNSTDDLADEADHVAFKAVDRIVDDLPTEQSSAVKHKWLEERFTGRNLSESLESAYRKIYTELRKLSWVL